MKNIIAALSLSAAFLSAAQSDASARLQAAADVFKDVMGIPDKSIPQDLLNKAQCIIIVPGLKKGAFIVGAKYGKGFVSCRSKSGVGWGRPPRFGSKAAASASRPAVRNGRDHAGDE